MAAIVRRREKAQAKQRDYAPICERRLPNTARSNDITATPTPGELRDPHRTIRNLKLMIFDYQREQAANLRRIESLQRTFSELTLLPQSDFDNASGRRLRHDLGKMSRKVANMARRMRNSAINLSKGSEAASKDRSDKASAAKNANRAAIETLSAEQLKTGNADAWTWPNARIARTLNHRVKKNIDTPYRTPSYSCGQLVKVVAELKHERR